MSDTVSLPPNVKKIVDEIARIKKKIETLQALGGNTQPTEQLLKEAMTGILGELASEARYEIIALQEAAQRLNQDVRPPAPDPNARNPEVPANEDIKRLEEFEEERKRIKEKLKHAKRHAPPGEPTDLEEALEKQLASMDARIRRAAREAARREIRELNEDIADLRDGKPRRDHGNGPGAKPGKPDAGGKEDDDDDRDDDADGGGSGGGSGGSGDDSDDEDKPKGVGQLKGKPAEVPTIFVQTETKVFAWDARLLRWNEMDFISELISVTKITGGILAFSDRTAALYDSYLGTWLPALDVPGGGIKAAS